MSAVRDRMSYFIKGNIGMALKFVLELFIFYFLCIFWLSFPIISQLISKLRERETKLNDRPIVYMSYGWQHLPATIAVKRDPVQGEIQHPPLLLPLTAAVAVAAATA